MGINNAKLFEAIEFAAKAHRGQFRKGTKIPYVIHPFGVGMKLLECGFSVELVVAGFLHDALEDTNVKAEDIRKRFGERVLKIVRGATEPEHGSKPWKERKAHTIEHLKSATQDVVIVSCADKLDNICSLIRDYQRVGAKLWKRFNAPKEEQGWYYRSLEKVFSARAKGMKHRKIFEEFHDETRRLFK